MSKNSDPVELTFTVKMSLVEANDIKNMMGFTSDEALAQWMAASYAFNSKDYFRELCINPVIEPS